MPTLNVLQGPDRGRTFEVVTDSVLIGRNSPDLPFSDNTISRRHALLEHTDGAWQIQDLNSANGTYVNGVKITGSMSIQEGDQVRCGTTLLVFGGTPRTGIAGEHGTGLRIDEDGNIVESAIMTTVPSNDDSVILAAPENANAAGNLRLLYDLSNAISSIFDSQQLLDKVMDMIFDNFPAERGFILLSEHRDKPLEPVVIRYRSSEQASQEITISHTIVDYVMSHMEGVVCSNAMRDPRFAKGKSVHDYGIRSALCVPVSVRDRNIGVIYIDSTVATHTYATEQLRLLAAVGFQTGLALEHARLYQAGVQAERLAAAGETVAYLSHGIKNILQGLQSAVDMVQMGLDKNKIDTARRGWKILHRNMTRIQNLVLNMLAFSKVRRPHMEMMQINQAVADVIEMLTIQADESGVVLMSELDDSLPAVAVDPDGIQQVLLNLVLNALDVVAQDTGVITITTRYDSSASQVILSVKDNGPGIPESQMSGIFNAFHSTKGHGGTGLGLAVVQKIVEEHKGTVSVDSKVGQGTTFILRLPTGDADMGIDSGGTAGPSTGRRGFPIRR